MTSSIAQLRNTLDKISLWVDSKINKNLDSSGKKLPSYGLGLSKHDQILCSIPPLKQPLTLFFYFIANLPNLCCRTSSQKRSLNTYVWEYEYTKIWVGYYFGNLVFIERSEILIVSNRKKLAIDTT